MGRLAAEAIEALKRVPIPKQGRIGDLLRRNRELARWLTKESAPANRFRNGLTYLKRTGASGQRFLRDATGATRSRMLRYYDRANFQIRLTKAKALDPDVSRSDVRGLLDDLGELDDAQLREFDDILSDTGTAGVRRMTAMDADDLRLLTGLRFSRAVKSRYVRQSADLSASAQRQLDELVHREPRAIKLTGELNDADLARFMDLDIGSAREFREAAARHFDAGIASEDEIAAFARHADNLEGAPGLESGPVAKAISAGSPGNFRGALREVEVADDIGAENIRRMNLEVGPSGTIGELDIKLVTDEVIEVKRTFGTDPRTTFSQIEDSLIAMREHPDTALDGNTLTIRSENVRDIQDVQEKIDFWEGEVANSAEWNNANIDIRVIDDTIGEVVAD